MAQIWTFETPVNVTATSLVNITWNPRTFNSVEYGNFLLNLWLLRGDYQGDTEVREHEAFLLAGDQNVFNTSVLWKPTIDDIDFDVPEAGTHQLSWEQSKNNPSHSPFNTSFEGWSIGFHVKALLSSPVLYSTSTSASPTSTIPTSTTVTTPITSSISQEPATAPSSQSGTNTPIIIGLVIGLGLLLLTFLAAAFWGVRKYRLAKRRNPQFKESSMPLGYPSVPNSEMSYNSLPSSLPDSTPNTTPQSAPISRSEMDGYPRRDIKPAELAAPRTVAEL